MDSERIVLPVVRLDGLANAIEEELLLFNILSISLENNVVG
jgi:hypothetical protein